MGWLAKVQNYGTMEQTTWDGEETAMKNDLTCAVVRDLLPAYTEGLTEEETNQAYT